MNRHHAINWRREAIYPAQAMAEACLIAPWLLMFLSMSVELKPEVVTTACFFIILGTLYSARVMIALRVNEWVQRGVMLIGILGLSGITLRWLLVKLPMWANVWSDVMRSLSILINLVPGAVLILLSAVWLFWRGLRMADRPVSVPDAMMGFQIGVVTLAVLTLASTSRTVMIFVPTFFFSELLAVGLTRVESISLASTGRRLPREASGWWLAVLVGSTGSLVMLAGLIATILLGVGLDNVLVWLSPVLAIIAAPFALLMTPLMLLLEWLLRAIQGPIRPILDELTNMATQLQNWADQATRVRSPLVTLILHVLLYAVIIVVVLVVMYVLISVILKAGRRSGAKGSNQDEEHESLFSRKAWLDKLRQRLRDRLARLRNLADIAGRFGADGLFTALTIRRIYAQTTQLAASRGYPRPVARTPYEHLPTLTQAFLGCEAELAQITEAYVGVHYGELPERPEALEEMRAAFERIKTSEKQNKSPDQDSSITDRPAIA